MPLQRCLIDDDALPFRNPFGIAHHRAGEPVRTHEIDLATLERQDHVLRSRIAHEDLDLCPRQPVESRRKDVCRRRPRSRRRHHLVAAQILESLERRLVRMLPHSEIDIVDEPPDVRHLGKLEAGLFPLHHRIEGQRLRQRREHRAVLGRKPVHVAGGNDAPRAGHVLRNDRWIPRYEPAQKLRRDPTVDVVTTTRRIADHQAKLLALVEVGDRFRLCATSQRQHPRQCR